MKPDNQWMIGDVADPRLPQALSRREVIKRSSAGLAGVILATGPASLALSSRAEAQGAGTVTSALQFALRLEYLEAALYEQGLAAFGTGTQAFTVAERGAVTQIVKHENAHVAVLKAALGSTAPAKPTSFDFTGGSGAANGPFPGVLLTKAEFFKVAQLLEDFGVRAYKGQLATLASDVNVLLTAAQIHSVEARHAAQVRRLRGQNAWITGTTATGYTTTAAPSGKTQAEVAAAVYGPVNPTVVGASAGEDNLTHGTIAFTSPVTTEAFDEPVDAAAVAAVTALFGA